MNQREARRYAYGFAAASLTADLDVIEPTLAEELGSEARARKVAQAYEAIRDMLRRRAYRKEEKDGRG